MKPIPTIKNEMTAALRSALVTFAVLAAAPAHSLVIGTTDGAFHDPVGGANVVITDTPNGSIIRWGAAVTNQGQSGLQFNGLATGTVTPQVDFLLGDLTHFNQPIRSGTAASGVDLTVALDMLGTTPNPVEFGFGLVIDETPNRTPCSYDSFSPCADKVSILGSQQVMTFTNGGEWTLDLFFRDMDGDRTSDFISQEGNNNTALLFGRFVAPRSPQAPSEVPGPLPVLGLGAAFDWSRKLRRRMAQEVK